MPEQPFSEGHSEDLPAQDAAGVAEAVEETVAAEAEEKPRRLNMTVEVRDVGPCRKHVRVSIDRADVDQRLDEKISEMVRDAFVPGYRPGKAPRKLVEKRYAKEVADQVKGELLLQSLEQLTDDKRINPIAQPNFDPLAVELPKEGPLVYEFEVEVAPEFELPEYKGLKIKRPVRRVSDKDVDQALQDYLRRKGQPVTKDGPAQVGDIVVADITFSHQGKEINRSKEVSIRVDPQLAFKDGVISDFGEKMAGVKAGESRTLDLTLAQTLSDPELRGQVIQARFDVHAVQEVKPAEPTPEFLQSLGVESLEELRNFFRQVLEREVQLQQRRLARQQVTDYLARTAQWELPPSLVARQARRTLQKMVLELQSAGMSEEEIRNRSVLLQQNALNETERALKEQFVLQKIAEVEKIEVTDEDVAEEIDRIAEQTGESPRRVRARLEKEDLMESLMGQILERKALELVLAHAEYEDIEYKPEEEPEVIEEQAVPGATVELPEAPEEPTASGSEEAPKT
ncbi:MAG: trigger factor [Gemmatales bacterium]|nr:trigger factor [Gemmatales bacterium]MDW8385720.1 trigger factor [Gemmatales bacterium]